MGVTKWRESALRQASSELASTRERLRLTVDQGEREIAALTDELEAEVETREDLEAALDALEAEKAAAEAKHREREELHEREKQEKVHCIQPYLQLQMLSSMPLVSVLIDGVSATLPIPSTTNQSTV